MNLEQFFQILRARKWVALLALTVVVLTTLVVSLILPKQYTAEATLAIDVKATDPVTGMQVAGQLIPGYMATQVDIITSHNTATKVVEMLGMDKLPEAQQKFQQETQGKGQLKDWLAQSLLKNLDVKPSRESSVVNLEYTSPDPKFSSALANAFAQAYIRNVVDMRSNSAQQNNAFFQEQIKGLQKALEEAQKRRSEYQQTQGIVASDERLDVETQRLNEISSQLVAAQSLAFDAQSRSRGGSEVAPDVLNNPLIQQLKNQLAQQEAKFKELAEKDGPNHPRYQQANAELNSTRQQLAELTRQYSGGLSSTANNSTARVASLQHSLNQQKEKVLELKSQRGTIDVLQRDVDNAQRAYDQAMQRLSQTALESRSDVANVAILKAAPEPVEHSKPKLLLNLIVAVFMGTLLGVGFALLLELLDRRVRSVQDLEQMLDITVLANLAQSGKGKSRKKSAARIANQQA